MGNFCTQCGRPLQEGEVCNCTQQTSPVSDTTQQVAPPPSPVAYQQVPPQPIVPSQSAIEVKQGFNNLLTALKKIWVNPTQAASALAQKDSWLPALILIVAQALFTACFALTNFGVGLGLDDGGFLALSFFYMFLSSLALSAAAMGMFLGIGKAVKGNVSFKSALATASIRCFICLPFTLFGLLIGMANIEIGLFFFFFGEIIAGFLTILAVQENYKINTNRAFLVVCSTYLVLFILFVIATALFNAVSPETIYSFHSTRDLYSSYNWSDLFD